MANYDTKCFDLAEAFLSDTPHLATTDRTDELAALIQRTIEDFIADAERNYEPPDPPFIERRQNQPALGASATLKELLEIAQIHQMTPEEIEAQRQSWVRGMTTGCEHGELDFEQCPQCRRRNS